MFTKIIWGELLMIKIAILGVIAVLLALQFNDKKEYSTYISIVCMVLVALFVLDKVKVVTDVIEQFNKYTGIDIVYIKMLLKMIGITYISEISTQICIDAGYEGIGKQIEIAGKFTILAIGMPILLNVMKMITTILR